MTHAVIDEPEWFPEFQEVVGRIAEEDANFNIERSGIDGDNIITDASIRASNVIVISEASGNVISSNVNNLKSTIINNSISSGNDIISNANSDGDAIILSAQTFNTNITNKGILDGDAINLDATSDKNTIDSNAASNKTSIINQSVTDGNIIISNGSATSVAIKDDSTTAGDNIIFNADTDGSSIISDAVTNGNAIKSTAASDASTLISIGQTDADSNIIDASLKEHAKVLVKVGGDQVAALGKSLGEQIIAQGEMIGEQTKTSGENVGEHIKAVGEAIGDQTTSIGSGFGEQTKALGESIAQQSEGIQKAIGENTESVGQSIGDQTKSIDDCIGTLGESIGTNLADQTKSQGEMSGVQTKSIGDGISNQTDAIGNALATQTKSIGTVISNEINSLGESIGNQTKSFGKDIGALIESNVFYMLYQTQWIRILAEGDDAGANRGLKWMDLILEDQTSEDMNQDGKVYGVEYMYDKDFAPKMLRTIEPHSEATLIVREAPQILTDPLTGKTFIKLPDIVKFNQYQELIDEFSGNVDLDGDGNIFGKDYLPADTISPIELQGVRKRNEQVVIINSLPPPIPQTPVKAFATIPDIFLEATNEGTNGNLISFEIIKADDPDTELQSFEIDNKIIIVLATDSFNLNPQPTAASTSISGLLFNAVNVGSLGNSINVELIDTGSPNEAFNLQVNSLDIVITMETNGTSFLQTTLDDIIVAIAGNIDASALVTTVLGLNVNGFTKPGDTGGPIFLQGGRDQPNSAGNVSAHINSEHGTLLTATPTGTGLEKMDPLATVFLEGGVDPLFTVVNGTEIDPRGMLLAREAQYRIDLDNDGLIYGTDYIYDNVKIPDGHPLKEIETKTSNELITLYLEGGNLKLIEETPEIQQRFVDDNPPLDDNITAMYDINNRGREIDDLTDLNTDDPVIYSEPPNGTTSIDSGIYLQLKEYKYDVDFDGDNLVYGTDYIFGNNAPEPLADLQAKEDNTIIYSDALPVDTGLLGMLVENRDEIDKDGDGLIYGKHYVFTPIFRPTALSEVEAKDENTIIYDQAPETNNRADPDIIILLRENQSKTDLNEDGFIYGKDYIFNASVVPPALANIQPFSTVTTFIYDEYTQLIDPIIGRLLQESTTGLDKNDDGRVYGYDYVYHNTSVPVLLSNAVQQIDAVEYGFDPSNNGEIETRYLTLLQEVRDNIDLNGDGKIYGTDYIFTGVNQPIAVENVGSQVGAVEITDPPNINATFP